ncbi:hypothetical protein NC651_034562 [Populus alba x Populus x berolinensis]|nr:hypothetical protein NC651_034562 [Populus alba x Populus x berolinensis]
MVAYAAAHCPWKEHTQQLRRGGELLTHVSLLMLHLGLSEQYEYNIQADIFYLKGGQNKITNQNISISICLLYSLILTFITNSNYMCPATFV